MDYWCIKNGLNRVNVYPVQQQRTKRLGPVTVYRSKDSGITYSARHIRTWAELSAEQRVKAYRDAYQARRSDALWQIAKDPSLADQLEAWKAEAKAERDKALLAIANGDDVPPPKRWWE